MAETMAKKMVRARVGLMPGSRYCRLPVGQLVTQSPHRVQASPGTRARTFSG